MRAFRQAIKLYLRLLFGLHNLTPKRNQKSKRKRKIHKKKNNNLTSNQITKNKKYKKYKLKILILVKLLDLY